MNQFKFETHLHTSEVSDCASCSGAEQARIYKNLGYSGIIITDHFFNGNTCVPRNLPWEERVNKFMKGYENAFHEGQKLGLTVLFGWEESLYGGDFLVYGLDKKWLLEHPDILTWDLAQHYKRIHADGGYIVRAHPFREAPYINEIKLYPDYEDAVEISNASHKDPKFDKQAAQYAKLHNKPVTGGSDAHHADSNHSGMFFDHKLMNIQDFINSIRNRSGITIIE
jgi:histidinol phosphatase-like PHP family hydrolase